MDLSRNGGQSGSGPGQQIPNGIPEEYCATVSTDSFDDGDSDFADPNRRTNRIGNMHAMSSKYYNSSLRLRTSLEGLLQEVNDPTKKNVATLKGEILPKIIKCLETGRLFYNEGMKFTASIVRTKQYVGAHQYRVTADERNLIGHTYANTIASKGVISKFSQYRMKEFVRAIKDINGGNTIDTSFSVSLREVMAYIAVQIDAQLNVIVRLINTVDDYATRHYHDHAHVMHGPPQVGMQYMGIPPSAGTGRDPTNGRMGGDYLQRKRKLKREDRMRREFRRRGIALQDGARTSLDRETKQILINSIHEVFRDNLHSHGLESATAPSSASDSRLRALSAAAPQLTSAGVPIYFISIPSESPPATGFTSTSTPRITSASVPGYTFAPAPGFTSVPVPGFIPTPVPGFISTPAPGYTFAAASGFIPASAPGFIPASAPGFIPTSASGFTHTSVPGFTSAYAPRFTSASAPSAPIITSASSTRIASASASGSTSGSVSTCTSSSYDNDVVPRTNPNCNCYCHFPRTRAPRARRVPHAG